MDETETTACSESQCPTLVEESSDSSDTLLERSHSDGGRRGSVSMLDLMDLSTRGLAALDLSASQSSLVGALKMLEMETEAKQEQEAPRQQESVGVRNLFSTFFRNMGTIADMIADKRSELRDQRENREQRQPAEFRMAAILERDEV